VPAGTFIHFNIVCAGRCRRTNRTRRPESAGRGMTWMVSCRRGGWVLGSEYYAASLISRRNFLEEEEDQRPMIVMTVRETL